ncbi:amino acid adenylation domain-containing protein [Labrys sp. KNU-23]|uniref:amino acid adenylation domain-containing protein n=1 Tax=Labrys sp. KNU-23 TaxID=2789216 RepID=UPI0011EDF91B|nr:amino acid adenylation domain-containing protein [Labrys sp. KNU-23]QEN86966.1 amino acid adenylation domain-containing protein [Labrys sp. KNU-23]
MTIFQTNLPVHQLISEQAALRPDSLAVTCDGVSITFGELNARANQLAHRLLKMGVKPNMLVAIGLERSIDMVVGMLGIMKSGAAYLPLDPSYPRERLAFTLEDARPLAFVTTASGRPTLPPSDLPMILLDQDAESLGAESVANPDIAIDPQSLIYVIYTSGSTGRPKGCRLSHHNVVRLFHATDHWFGFGPEDVWTFFHSHAFDFSVWEIWGALVYGGRVVVVPHRISRSPEDFLDLLVQEKVTVLNQTPSAFRTLIEVERRRPEASALALRYVILGGEALEFQMLRPWFNRYGDAKPRIINMYGITETTVFVTYRPVSAAELDGNRASLIGVPIPDLTIHVLDENRKPVPVGEEGEIYVGGDGVCLGYLNRPELTAERFIDWQSSEDQASEKLYKTGDLVRRTADGDLEYLGRSDHQVKIRGFRIETGEIENQLMRHPAVTACAVIARTDGPGEAKLVAYIVPSAAPADAATLKAHLAQTLPDYMLPFAFVDLSELPMTENGKLDRKALPSPTFTASPIVPEARDELEQKIAAIWSRILSVPDVSTKINFFDQGGSSLQILTVLSEIQESIHPQLRLSDVFERPTITALANFIRASTAPATAPAARPENLRARQQAEALQRLRQRQMGAAR